MPPIDDLTLDQRRALEDALLRAFDYNVLKRTLLLRLGVHIDQEVQTNVGFRYVVTNVVDLFLANSSVDQLVRAALQDRPDNLKLQAVASELDVGTKAEEPAPSGQTEVTGEVETPARATLEKLVRDRSRLLDFGAFARGIERVGRQICRIEIPDGTAMGTGWLVGPDLVLTAYHVAEPADRGPYDGTDVVCRFDYAATGASGRTSALAATWLLDHSPYAAADLGTEGATAPTADELDYALLRLAEPVGSDDLDGTERGWIAVPENPTVAAVGDFMLIPQHPSGDALKVAFGEVLGYDAGGFRVRYDVTTEGGSSGSPCFDLDLAPFGIHHAAGPNDDQKFNQCVPLRHVVRRVRRLREGGADIPAFWTPASDA